MADVLSDRIRLRVLATSDLHAHVLAHDYDVDAPLVEGGLDRTAVLISQARAEAPGAILLDNGDFLHGTALSAWAVEGRAQACARTTAGGPAGEVEGSAEEGRAPPDPVIAAMNRLRFDAAALGNHEFDEPPERLAQALAQARFPLLCANAACEEGAWPAWHVVPWTIIARSIEGPGGRRHEVRVGVIGFLPPQTALWAGERLRGALRIRPILEAARAELPRLRAAGAQVVVALCHAGFEEAEGEEGEGEGREGAAGAALALAAAGGIDALVCGHTHRAFPAADLAPSPGVDPARGSLWGVPAVMPGWRGSHLGIIDLDLARAELAEEAGGRTGDVAGAGAGAGAGGGGWRVVQARAQLRAVRALPRGAGGGLDADPSVAAAHAGALARARRRVGETAIRLSSAFAHVGASTALDLVAQSRREAARRLIAATPDAGLPLLSTAAPVHAGGRRGAGRFTDVPPGPITMRHLADLCPHSDRLVVLRVTGGMLRDWLERAAGRFARVPPGAGDAMLLDEAFPSYDFDVLYGVEYGYDLSAPPRFDAAGRAVAPDARRLAWLAHEGRPVQDGDVFAIATKSHRVSGEGLYAPLAAAERIAQADEFLPMALARHIAAASPLEPAPAARWGFAPQPGATALFPAPEGADPPLGGGARVERAACAGRARAEGGVSLYRLHL